MPYFHMRDNTVPNRFRGLCRTCRQWVEPGEGFATPGLKGAHHAAGKCRPPTQRGFIYAVTGLGPLCDLIKVGRTEIDPYFRAELVHAGEDNIYWRTPFHASRQDRLAADPPQVWTCVSEDREAHETALIERLSPFRLPEPYLTRTGWRGVFRTDIDTVREAMEAVTGTPAVELKQRNDPALRSADLPAPR